MIHIRIVQECINVEGASVMTYDGVPFRSNHQVGGTDASYTSQLLDAVIILYQNHEAGNVIIQCAIHHFINDISLGQTVMRKRCFLIIYHDCDGALILQIFADPFIGQLTAVHPFRSDLVLRFLCVLRVLCSICCHFILCRKSVI